MNKSSETEGRKRSKSSSHIACRNAEGGEFNQAAEGGTSIRGLPFRSKKEEASRPIYLIRYE